MFHRTIRGHMHGRLLIACVLMTLVGLIKAPAVAAQSYDPIIWQKYKSKNTAAPADLITELQKEITQITSRQPLAPLRLNFADLDFEGYWYYLERGRVITTLATAYPYLTAAQQQAVKTYVGTYLASGAEAPWTTKTKTNGEGVDRNYHGLNVTMGRYPRDFVGGTTNTPVLHVIYGLWLYGDQTGDWQTIQPYWSQIKTFYNNNRTTHILYGQISGQIAMARLARQFNDSQMETTAVADANAQLAAGLNASTFETRQKATIYNFFYCARCSGYFPGQPWMYLESSPEMWRYLRDNQATEVTNRIGQFESQYKHWWLAQAPTFTRWTGDEGQGLTSEPFGMIFPTKRWITKLHPDELRKYVKSMPTAIGDLYWIEALSSSIQAYGQTCWVDVRTGQEVSCETAPVVSPQPSASPVACPTDFDGNNLTDLSDYHELVNSLLKIPIPNPKTDIDKSGLTDLTDYNKFVPQFLKNCGT